MVVRSRATRRKRTPSPTRRGRVRAGRARQVMRREAGRENPNLATGEIEVHAQERRGPERGQAAAVRDQPRSGRVDESAAPPATATWTCAAPRMQQQPRAAPPASCKSCATTSTQRGFLEIETPILDQEHARGRARLPGAEPRAAGRVLRAAAVAAAVQAAADGRRRATATSRSPAASATKTCAPTASRSSPSSTSRCRSSSTRTSSELIEGLLRRAGRDAARSAKLQQRRSRA